MCFAHAPLVITRRAKDQSVVRLGYIDDAIEPSLREKREPVSFHLCIGRIRLVRKLELHARTVPHDADPRFGVEAPRSRFGLG
jgi:hypothetical protein